MRAAGIPCGEVRTVGEAIRSPEARERNLVTQIPHPKIGWVPNVALPIRYSDTPIAIADPVAAPARRPAHPASAASSRFFTMGDE